MLLLTLALAAAAPQSSAPAGAPWTALAVPAACLHALESGHDLRLLTGVRDAVGHRLDVVCGRVGPGVSCAAYTDGHRGEGPIRVQAVEGSLRVEVGTVPLLASLPVTHASLRSLRAAFGPAIADEGLLAEPGDLPAELDPALQIALADLPLVQLDLK